MMGARSVAHGVLLLACVAAACAARADTLEPPPESPEGADYAIEQTDSLDAGSVEVGFGASGRAGERVRRSRRVRFDDGTLGGSLREGAGDPLAGGAIESRGALGRGGIGRVAPRWGRGLVVGAAGDPWSRVALDRGARAAFRGRSGQGAWWAAGGETGAELLMGRFARRDLAGARVRHRAWSLGLLGGRRGGAQSSLAWERASTGAELALDRAGRWRAEGTLERPLGEWSLAARVRGGLAGFQSLAEPSRSGPAQALALGVAREGAVRVAALGALWRFRAGVPGARAALEVERGLAHHGALAAGFEEQHGVRRDRAVRPGAFRQGLWAEWRGDAGFLGLSLRHETWGARRWAREAVRELTAVQAQLRGPAGATLRVTHSVHRMRRGESLYLPEAGADRLVLRAVSGDGARSRLELRAPGGGGWINAGLDLAATADPTGSGRKPTWTLNWTRRARTAGRGAKGGGSP